MYKSSDSEEIKKQCRFRSAGGADMNLHCFYQRVCIFGNGCTRNNFIHNFKQRNGKINKKQEMSQTRDECPQRNWSSIRHI